MPVFYASIADNHTGSFIGGVHLFALSKEGACKMAAERVPGRCVEIACGEVPEALALKVPAHVFGKLLDERELEALSQQMTGLALVHLESVGGVLDVSSGRDA